MSVRVLVGDARAVLAGLPAESVHCAITSPPYYGLRNYSTEPQVWGKPVGGCEHAWQDHPIRIVVGNNAGVRGMDASEAEHKRWARNKPIEDGNQKRIGSGQFCSLCNCWRGELGVEPTPELYVSHLVEVFAAVRRVLRRDGTLWVVIGDSFAGNRGNSEEKPGFDNKAAKGGANLLIGVKRETGLRDKELIGIPWLFAFAMHRDGWLIRQELCWSKTSAMPESVQDRCTRSHETIFMFVKQGRYFYDATAIAEPVAQSSIQRVSQNDGHPVYNGERQRGFPGQPQTLDINCTVPESGLRNKRSVWTINPEPLAEPHYAAYPSKLVDPMVRAGTSERGCCSTMIKKLRLRSDLTEAEREMVYARLGMKALA